MQLIALFPTINQFSPHLAVLVGLNEAIFLNQLDFYLQAKKHYKDGRYWNYNTIEEWQALFPWMSLRTTYRLIKDLETKGLLISTSKYNKMRTDRTKWYTINYDLVQELLTKQEAILPKWPDPSCQNGSINTAKMSSSNHIIPTEKNQEINAGINPAVIKLPSGEFGILVATEEEKLQVEKKMKSQFATAEEAQKAILESQSKLLQKEVKDGHSAMIYWRHVVPKLYENVKFQAVPTQKEIAMFKSFWKRAEGHGKAVIKEVLYDWQGFTAEVQDVLGTSKSPSTPLIQYLLPNVTIAVNWYLNKVEKQKSTAVPLKKVVSEIPTVESLWNKPKGSLIGD